MRNRACQFDVTHAFAANFGRSDLYATFFADDALEFTAFIFTTQALKILDRAKDFGTEQAITLRLKGTVVNRFWLFHFAM